jgi:hypothetical protein
MSSARLGGDVQLIGGIGSKGGEVIIASGNSREGNGGSILLYVMDRQVL